MFWERLGNMVLSARRSALGILYSAFGTIPQSPPLLTSMAVANSIGIEGEINHGDVDDAF